MCTTRLRWVSGNTVDDASAKRFSTDVESVGDWRRNSGCAEACFHWGEPSGEGARKFGSIRSFSDIEVRELGRLWTVQSQIERLVDSRRDGWQISVSMQ